MEAAFVHGLHAEGCAHEAPDIIVGTSAGWFVGSAIADGRRQRLTGTSISSAGFPSPGCSPI